MVDKRYVLSIVAASLMIAVPAQAGKVTICVNATPPDNPDLRARIENEAHQPADVFIRKEILAELKDALGLFRFVEGDTDSAYTLTASLNDATSPWPGGAVALVLEMRTRDGNRLSAVRIERVRRAWQPGDEPKMVDGGHAPWLIEPVRNMILSWDQNAHHLLSILAFPGTSRIVKSTVETDLLWDDIGSLPNFPPGLFVVRYEGGGRDYFLPCFGAVKVSGPLLEPDSGIRDCDKARLSAPEPTPSQKATQPQIYLARCFR